MKHLVPLVLFLGAATAPAATLTVTSLADAGAGSLREQLALAASGDTVAIAATGSIVLSTGEIVLTAKNVSIVGPGANRLTVTSNASTRALRLVNAQCSLSGLTFANCRALPGDVDTGGAIAVDNFTAGGRSNVVTITDCVFTGNQSGWGGALDVFNGGLVLERCTFSGNTCTGVAFGTKGGGGAVSLGPTVASRIVNCTFSGNTQSGVTAGLPGGGAIYNYGAVPVNPPPVAVEHCTFVANVDAAGAAGAIKGNFTGSFQTFANLRNNLLVGNQAPAGALRNFAGNATGALTASYFSLGGNVTDESASSAQFMPGALDKIGNANVAASIVPALALNGGALPTHALLRGSPAQRSGAGTALTQDQRGAPRHPQPDAGAFELIEPELALSVSGSALAEGGTLSLGPSPIGTSAVRTATVTNTQTSAFTTGPLVVSGASVGAPFALGGFPSVALANGESATFDVSLPGNEAGLFNASLNFTGNDRYQPALAGTGGSLPNQHGLLLAGLITDTADHWRRQYFGRSATNSGPAADSANPAGDGIANLLKYALGLNPLIAYAPGTGITAGRDSAGRLTLTVVKNPAAVDVALAVEVAGDLSNPGAWSAAGATVDQNTLTLLQAHDNTPSSAAPRRFIRLNVTRP